MNIRPSGWLVPLLILAGALPIRAETVVTTPLKTFGLGPLRCAIYTPDATKIIAAGDLGPITLLDAQTGQIVRTFTGHTGRVNSLACTADGKHLLSGGDDGTARLWDLATGNPLQSFMKTGEGAILAVALSPDARYIVTGSTQGKTRLWTSETSSTLLITATSSPCVTFSHDGQTIASGAGNKVHLWNPATGELLDTFSDHLATVRSVAFSPDDKKVISGSNDKIAIAWIISTGEIGGYYSCSNSVNSAMYSPDGMKVVTGMDKSNIILYNSVTGIEEKTIPTRCNYVECSRDGNKILSFYLGDVVYDPACRIQQWNVESGSLINSLYNYNGQSYSLILSPDGQLIVAGNQDGVARIWKKNTGDLVRAIVAETDGLYSIAISPDWKRMATGSSRGALRFWNLDTGQKLGEYTSHFTEIPIIRDMEYSPDGGRLIVCGSGLGIFELPRLKRIFYSRGNDYYSFQSVEYMPDSINCVIGKWDGSTQIINSLTGGLVRAFSGLGGEIMDVNAFPSGDRILSGSSNGMARIWNVVNGFPFRTFPAGNGPVYAVDVLPNEKQVLISGNSLRLYDVSTGDLQSSYMHGSLIYAIAVSADGRTVLSAGADNQIKLWNLPVPNCASNWHAYE